MINCISKINGVKIDNAEDLDIVMPMYNLLENSKNYTKTTGSLWNYYRDEPSNSLSSNSESFKYKTSITGNTYNVGAGEAGYDANKVGKNETEVVIPLKHLSNFWRSLNIPLINCEVELILTWSKNCVLADMTVDADADPAIVAPSGATFKITDTKLYVPVVTLSAEYNAKLSKLLSDGFNRTVYQNEYNVTGNKIVEITTNNEEKYIREFLDSGCQGVKRLFVLAYNKREGDNKVSVDTYKKYFLPRVKIENYYIEIDVRNFSDQAINNSIKQYNEIRKMSTG